MFGSTIEYCLRSFTNKYLPVEGTILDDGSMHSYKKQFHFIVLDGFNNFKNYRDASFSGNDGILKRYNKKW